MSTKKYKSAAKSAARHITRKKGFNVLGVLDEDEMVHTDEDSIRPNAVYQPMLSLSVAVPDGTVELSSSKMKKIEKKQLKEETKRIRLEKVQASKRKWSHGAPEIMEQHYLDRFEDSLAIFFRSGYERYINHGEPARKCDILSYVREIVKKYRLVVSGGYVLKNMGLSIEDQSKPSVDIDIYVPYYIPQRHPEFYQTMAELFNCDPGWDAAHPFKIIKFVANRAKGAKHSFFKKNGIYSVFKHERNVDGVYAEMDLVRTIDGVKPETIVRNFDLSVCMNWYNGDQLYSMDKNAIINKSEHTGWLNYGYIHLLLGIKNEHGTKHVQNPTTRDRILKYLLRGYRISYVHPKEGVVYEIVTRDLPNAVRRLPANKREQYYTKHPNERPANIPIILPVAIGEEIINEMALAPTNENTQVSPTRRSLTHKSANRNITHKSNH